MSRQLILDALNGIHDTYITEAAEALGLLGRAAPIAAKPTRDREDSLLYRFFNSGWGVAMICAVVSLSVLGGIIWAGQNPPAGGPSGVGTETHAETHTETAAPLISEEQAMEIASNYWNIRTGDVDPDTGYTFRIESLGQTQTPKGEVVYEVALRWLVDGSRYSTVETVWVDVMTGEVIIPYDSSGDTETETETPTFDVNASLAAIDKLSDENLFVALRYQTTTTRTMNKVTTGKFGEADGTYWTSMSDPVYGAAVMEEEGGYYHIFNLDFNQWRYYYTTVMTDSEAFENVYNARYWWKNYLDDLSFDAYDELTYTGNGQVLEENCHMFSYDGTVENLGQFKLALYVHSENRNVMKLELSIDYSVTHHVDDVVEAVIEISNLQTGDEVDAPYLRPKWDGPIEEPDETRDPTQGGVVIPPSDTEQKPSIDVESGTLEPLPLTSSNDTTSYIVLPDLWSGGATAIEFYILPTDTSDPTHTCALRYEIPENSTVNVQIVSVEKSPDEYSILFVMEYISNTVVDGVDTHRVFMTSAEIQFFTDASLSETQDCYYTLRGGKVADITYTDETMQDVIDTNRAESQAALEQAEALLANYTEDAGYQYTILYCYTKDGEIFNTPSYWIQPFFFELFKEWGLME